MSARGAVKKPPISNSSHGAPVRVAEPAPNHTRGSLVGKSASHPSTVSHRAAAPNTTSKNPPTINNRPTQTPYDRQMAQFSALLNKSSPTHEAPVPATPAPPPLTPQELKDT